MRQITTAIFFIAFIVSLIAFSFTFNQVHNEEERLENDILYRSSLLADSLKESVEPNFINKSDLYLQSVVKRFSDNTRIAGLAIVDNQGAIVATSSELFSQLPDSQQIATDVMDSDKANGTFTTSDNKKMYVFASPLHNGTNVVGSLVIVHNASYIDTRLADIWKNNMIRLLIQISAIAVTVLLFLRWVILIPVRKLAEALRSPITATTDTGGFFANSLFFKPLANEITNMRRSLFEARIAASEEAKAALEKLDTPWTAERLKQFTKDILKNRSVIAVSNLEPYIHTKQGSKIVTHVPASGLITAIEPVMQACGGMWVAQGIGDADKLVVDNKDMVLVPTEDPKYTLKRVWLTDKEMDGYYHGFSDQALYPLFHMAHTRPVFREDDWEEYKKVNGKFAESILAEIKDLKKPIIFIQDFQFTLLPRIIKKSRPDATVGIFWHIPWVSPESFSICPWKKEILNGMLGADLIGFHTQLHCNNFIDTVGRELEALIDYEQFTVTKDSHISLIKPFPISIAFSNDQQITSSEDPATSGLLKSIGVHSECIGVGVDRLDYIKGIMDRLVGIEIFFDSYPEYRTRCTFIQISSPSESKTKKYIEFAKTVEQEVERINNRFATKQWKPIVYLAKHHSHNELKQYYRLANFCLITSLHDGMNLVAKEFVASRTDEKGVLILSQFAGAAKELKDALIINPYNGKQTAEAIHTALQMPPSEQIKRMKKLRNSVRNYNIYRWSAEFLKTLTSLG